MITPREAIPRDWCRLIGNGPLGIGGDLATTEKDLSNPSSITVTEQVGPRYIERLVLRWKTSKEEVSRAMFNQVFLDLQAAKKRPRRLCLDATNEKFFAQRLAKMFSKHCPVQLVVSSENIEVQGETFLYKVYLGNLYVNTYADAQIWTPNAKWLSDDRRLVKRDKGSFSAATAPDGSHADTFDSGKLARFALEGRGRAEISAAAVGKGSQTDGKNYTGLVNPLLRAALNQRRKGSC